MKTRIDMSLGAHDVRFDCKCGMLVVIPWNGNWETWCLCGRAWRLRIELDVDESYVSVLDKQVTNTER